MGFGSDRQEAAAVTEAAAIYNRTLDMGTVAIYLGAPGKNRLRALPLG